MNWLTLSWENILDCPGRSNGDLKSSEMGEGGRIGQNDAIRERTPPTFLVFSMEEGGHEPSNRA